MINSPGTAANQEIVYKDYVNLGIAAATPRGLIVPNIKDAGRLTLPELADALERPGATAREGRTRDVGVFGKTQPADMSGGTFTITNVGVFGVDTGTPILNPGRVRDPAFGADQAATCRGCTTARDQDRTPGDHARALLRPPDGRRRAGLQVPTGGDVGRLEDDPGTRARRPDSSSATSPG
jgi:hypothetical protein